MSAHLDGEEVRQITLDLVEARLTYTGVESREEDEAANALFHAFDRTLDDLAVDELRAVIDDLSDIAWDLADSWARDVDDIERVIANIREGWARGW